MISSFTSTRAGTGVPFAFTALNTFLAANPAAVILTTLLSADGLAIVVLVKA